MGNTDQNNSEYGHFLRSAYQSDLSNQNEQQVPSRDKTKRYAEHKTNRDISRLIATTGVTKVSSTSPRAMYL